MDSGGMDVTGGTVVEVDVSEPVPAVEVDEAPSPESQAAATNASASSRATRVKDVRSLAMGGKATGESCEPTG